MPRVVFEIKDSEERGPTDRNLFPFSIFSTNFYHYLIVLQSL